MRAVKNQDKVILQDSRISANELLLWLRNEIAFCQNERNTLSDKMGGYRRFLNGQETAYASAIDKIESML